jgi:hypothetical protein
MQFSSVGVMWINGPWQEIVGYQFGKMALYVCVTLGNNVQKDHFSI